MIASIVSFDLSPMLRKLERAAPELVPYLPEITIDTARLVVSSSGNVPGMVQLIPPSHEGVNGPAAGRHGKMKVAGDISRVYMTPGVAFTKIKESGNEPMAKAFWVTAKSAVRRSKGKTRVIGSQVAEMRRLISASGTGFPGIEIGVFDGGSLHGQRRKDGVVPKRNRPGLLVLDPKALKAYVKHKQGNVGIMASTFNKAAGAMGAHGVPKFIKDHGDKFSSFQIVQSATGFWVIMTPRINFGLDEIERRWGYVMQYRWNAIASRGFITRLRKIFLAPASASAAA